MIPSKKTMENMMWVIEIDTTYGKTVWGRRDREDGKDIATYVAFNVHSNFIL